jgi:hypothetical protein
LVKGSASATWFRNIVDVSLFSTLLDDVRLLIVIGGEVGREFVSKNNDRAKCQAREAKWPLDPLFHRRANLSSHHPAEMKSDETGVDTPVYSRPAHAGSLQSLEPTWSLDTFRRSSFTLLLFLVSNPLVPLIVPFCKIRVSGSLLRGCCFTDDLQPP